MKELTAADVREKLAKKTPKIEPLPPPAATTVPAVPTGQWQLVGKDMLIPREDNPRRINVKAPSFLELVASVGGPAGIVTPLLGRPHPTRAGCIELLAGHRRRLAGLQAGLVEFPVVVREMDDRTALEVLVFENLDRENLMPLEEARGVDLLLKSGHEAAEIASRMGKTPQWVARRAQLLALTAKWQQFAEDNNVTAAHLELIARCPKKTQDELLQRFDHDHAIGRCFTGRDSLKELRASVAKELMELKLAPWDHDNAVLLPKAGACSKCPKRSGCNPDLFDEELDGKGDRCLDRDCWRAKHAAHRKLREAELRKEHKNLVLIKGEGYDYEECEGARTLDSLNFKECKQSADGATPALIISGKGQGQLTWVKVGSSGGTREKVAGKKKDSAAGKQAAASLDPKASAALLKEKQAAHEQRRWAWVCKHLQEMLMENELPTAPKCKHASGMLVLVASFGTQATCGATSKAWKNAFEECSIDTIKEAWDQVRPKIHDTLNVFTVGSLGAHHHTAIAGVARLFQLDVDELKAEADKEIPEPKSWGQLRKLAEAPAKKVEQKAAKDAKGQRLNKAGKPIVREVDDYKCDKCGVKLLVPAGMGDAKACLLEKGEMLCRKDGGDWEPDERWPEDKAPAKPAKKKARTGKMAAAGDDSEDGETWTPDKEPKKRGKKKVA